MKIKRKYVRGLQPLKDVFPFRTRLKNLKVYFIIQFDKSLSDLELGIPF